ncbi:uncharacterized protein LOC104898812 [Beta vulgaris subsp. vulgaris]|uniref:uncharacterized protein LOC104898812 n=1 Tax=Beta vulgaris subsp. vulgaris TaxID=3555 RepID=UPI00053F7ACE|nr:uncharacterized protein LOC104898812 [Beta vulgaris subsp. vulgaris]
MFGLDLDSEYDHIVTTLIHYYPFLLNFDDLRPKSLLHEQRLKSSKDGSDSPSHHALVAVQFSGSGFSNKNTSGSRNKGKNNKNKGCNNDRNSNNRDNGGQSNARGSGNNNTNASLGRQNGMSTYSKFSLASIPCIDSITNDPSSARYNPSSGNLSSTPTFDTCGLCWFPGHQVAYCPQRFNSIFVSSAPYSVTQACTALFVGGEANDSVWYPDSGVASHMTTQDGKLSVILSYAGSSSVVV